MLTRTLEELKVNDVVWSLTSNDKYHQVLNIKNLNDQAHLVIKDSLPFREAHVNLFRSVLMSIDFTTL